MIGTCAHERDPLVFLAWDDRRELTPGEEASARATVVAPAGLQMMASPGRNLQT